MIPGPRSVALLLCVAGTWSGVANAQVRPGIFGHLVSGSTGISGEFCHTFDCTPRQHLAVAGERLRLIVNAPYQALFAIGASFSATSCVSLPFAGNMLVLDAPLVTLAIGTVNQPSPILACWGGTVDVPLQLPTGLPPGVSFATQAVADMPTLSNTQQPSFSVAIVTTIR